MSNHNDEESKPLIQRNLLDLGEDIKIDQRVIERRITQNTEMTHNVFTLLTTINNIIQQKIITGLISIRVLVNNLIGVRESEVVFSIFLQPLFLILFYILKKNLAEPLTADLNNKTLWYISLMVIFTIYNVKIHQKLDHTYHLNKIINFVGFCIQLVYLILSYLNGHFPIQLINDTLFCIWFNSYTQCMTHDLIHALITLGVFLVTVLCVDIKYLMISDDKNKRIYSLWEALVLNYFFITVILSRIWGVAIINSKAPLSPIHTQIKTVIDPMTGDLQPIDPMHHDNTGKSFLMSIFHLLGFK